MNLPERVDDPSLLQHEPLCTYLGVLETSKNASASRSSIKDAVSGFVDAMQQDSQAVAAAKLWAYLVFKDVLADKDSFEAMDGGEKLYKVFLEYQVLLCRGLRDGNTDEAYKYQSCVLRTGMGAIELKDHGANTQRTTRGGDSEKRVKGHRNQRPSRPQKVSGPKKVHHQVTTGGQHLAHVPATEVACSDLTKLTADMTMSGSATQQVPPFDTPSVTSARPCTVLEAAKSSKGSESKMEKKRKASSQKPPVITASDASEDDKELLRTHPATIGNSVTHPAKRFASQVDKKGTAHGARAIEQHCNDAGASRIHSTLTSFRSKGFVSHPRIEGRHRAGFSFSNRKRDKERIPKVTTQISGCDFIRSRKIKSVKDLQTRAGKRSRRTSMSALGRELIEGSKSTHDLRAESLPESRIQTSIIADPPLTREKHMHVESKTRKKRTRPEFETGLVMPNENTSADSHESLGPDIRSLRPLPQKLCDRRLVPVTDSDTAVHVPYGVSSLEHADQLLRDGASNALAILREGVESDVPDWTQEREHDTECDGFGGHDEDEANDVQVTAVTSTPPMVIPKLPLPAPPRIWAQSRQEVCESVEYFRCYHGGVYSKDDIVKGYLLGAYSASRDIFHHGGKLIISHGGGKSESVLDNRKGPKRYQTDQDQEASDRSVRALLKTCKDRRPIALLADDKYALFPYDLTSANYAYVVLGLYWISHAWAECQFSRDGSGRVVRWKFAFQWCEGQGDPWWAPQQEIVMDITSDSPKPILHSDMLLTQDSSYPGGDPSIRCEICQQQSPFIYNEGWMCLNPRCTVFWNINGKDPKQLDYREEFLNILPQKFERLPDIIPARVTETPGGVTTTHAFSKGWHCTECGRLSSRYKWEHWECSNCHLKHVVNGRVRSPKEFWHQRSPSGFLHSQIGKDSGILACPLEPINLETHKGFTNRLTFILPYDRGKIHLILGTPMSNGDADSIFQLYQQEASTGELKLRRHPLRNHRARGPLLTNYFSQNSGEPYQYVGGSGHTVPFHEAPDCVRRALALIKERSSLALRIDIPFNEVLSAAYMERQKMSFHSDSEKGLGPIVASLSLGSAALMHFRPHVSTENLKSKSAYALSLVLRHGDVLVMEGEGVQKHYEHTVVPMNFRIAATARCIGSA